MSLSKPSTWAFLLCLGVITVSSTALGDARTEARSHFKKGMGAIAAGKYEQGVEELQKAYEILPHPNVLYNIARAYVEMGDLDNAITYYKRYAEENPPDKDEVRAIIGQLQGRVDRQKAALAAAQQASPTPGAPSGGGEAPAGGAPAQPTGQAGPQPESKGAGAAASPAPAAGGEKLSAGETKTEAVYEESVVTASRGAAQSPLDSPNSTTIITEQDIRLSGLTKIPELLRRVAGMDVMEVTSGWTETSMRGFNQRISNKLLVLVDGRSVYADFTGGTIWEALSIDVDQIERIEVVRGPGSALYGADAFAGVVNILTKAPGTGKSGARVGVGEQESVYGSLRATGRTGDFAYRASAGYTYNPRWSFSYEKGRNDLNLGKEEPNLGSEFQRMDLRTTDRLGKDVLLGVGGGFAHGRTNFYSVGDLRDYQLPDMYIGDVTLFLNTKKFNIRTYYNFIQTSIQAGFNYIAQDLYPSRIKTNVVDGEAVYNDNFDTAFGALAVNVGADYRLRQGSSGYIDGDHAEHHFGAFGQVNDVFNKTVSLMLSGRADYVPYLERFEASPRASLLVHPNERSTFRGSFSTAFRKPTFLEAYTSLPVQGLQGSVTGQVETSHFEKVNPERILTAEVGYLNQMSDFFDVDIAAYFNRVTDLIVLRPPVFVTPSDRLGPFGSFDTQSGRYPGQLTGFTNSCVVTNVVGGEVGVRAYPIAGLDFFANYALNIVNDDRPSGCTIPSDQRTSQHKFNVGVQYRTKPGVDGEVTFNYVTDQRWVERDLDPVTGSLVYKTFPLAGYGLLNARIGYRFLSNRLEVSVAAFNLLNNVHQEHPFTQFVTRRVMGFVQYQF